MMRKDLKVGDIFTHGMAIYYMVIAFKDKRNIKRHKYPCLSFDNILMFTNENTKVHLISRQDVLNVLGIKELPQCILDIVEIDFECEYI